MNTFSEEERDRRFRRRLDLSKTVLAAAAAAFGFFVLTRPDAILNRTVSRENVRRERAKLVIDVLREHDPDVRTVALDALESSYKEDDDRKWLTRTRQIVSALATYRTKQAQLADILRQRGEASSTTKPEDSPAYRALQEQSRKTTAELEAVKRELQVLRFEPPKTTDGGAMGCVTLDVFDVTAGSALLMGAAAGSRTREWFDFGDVPAMGYSIPAVNGVGTARPLQPKATYYYRYVVQNGNTTCLGDVKSFSTSG
jgi:hypothetical protein